MGQRNSARKLEPTEVQSDEARQSFGDLLDRAAFKGERFLITRHNKPMAVLIGAEDWAEVGGAGKAVAITP